MDASQKQIDQPSQLTEKGPGEIYIRKILWTFVVKSLSLLVVQG
jgi:hypothetical protein